MAHKRLWRTSLLTLSASTLLLWVGAACLGVQGAPKKEAAPKSQPFPLNLFASAKPDDYVGEQTCAGCHPDRKESFDRSPHALYVHKPDSPTDRRGCEACHGPGKNHIEHFSDDPVHHFIMSYRDDRPKEAALGCLRCHSETMRFSQWHRTAHGRANVGCTSCHVIHQESPQSANAAKTQTNLRDSRSPLYVAQPDVKHLLKADEMTMCGQCHRREVTEFRRNFHHPVPEGRMTCTDCHEIHPDSKSEKRAGAPTRLQPAGLHMNTRETCVTCHAEFTGPFVYEHDPAAGWSNDGCMECHKPHGSHNPKLLTQFSRGVCNQCHTDKANNHYPGRSCFDAVGCHVGLHGSNTDPNLLAR